MDPRQRGGAEGGPAAGPASGLPRKRANAQTAPSSEDRAVMLRCLPEFGGYSFYDNKRLVSLG